MKRAREDHIDDDTSWNCGACQYTNHEGLMKCKRCHKARTLQEARPSSEPAGGWAEAVDPVSRHIYYYNYNTGVSQWERPAELGMTGKREATGWFGRGLSDDNGIGKLYVENNKRYLARPARQQKDIAEAALNSAHHKEHSGTYNVWYGTYSGDTFRSKGGEKHAVVERCVVETDAGATKADAHGDNKSRSFCLHFAKGTCAKGAECHFFHRIPLPEDDHLVDDSVDCFGRERHAEHRDDMEGTGSFLKPSRTLYVGRLRKEDHGGASGLERELWTQFGEWGELEAVNVIANKPIGFVRYRCRANAEFAREAMNLRSLGKHGDVMAVKWAHDDPNPEAQRQIEEADRRAVLLMVEAQGKLLPASVSVEEEEEKEEEEEEEERLDDAKNKAMDRLGML